MPQSPNPHPSAAHHHAAETLGSKIFGAFKSSPTAFRLLAKIRHPQLRLAALASAWRAAIDGSNHKARYLLELHAERYRQKPGRDNADDYAVAALGAADRGLLPAGLCDILLIHLRRGSAAWRKGIRQANADLDTPPSTPSNTAARRALEEIQSDIADLR